MVWTINDPIRVGDQFTNLIAGEIALNINRLHERGYDTQFAFFESPPNAFLVNSPTLVWVTPPIVAYAFGGKTLSPPYIVMANLFVSRPTSHLVGVWIGRTKTHLAGDPNTNMVTPINFEMAGQPDATMEASTDGTWVCAVKPFLTDLPVNVSYSGGTTTTYAQMSFIVAVAPLDGLASNAPAVDRISISIWGGR